jgi:hypothetical protein
MILAGKMTIGGKKALVALQKNQLGFRMEYFQEDQLQTNVTHHKKVPRHEVLASILTYLICYLIIIHK